MEAVYLAVIGVGGVGKAFLDQLAKIPLQLRPSLVLISRSSRAILSSDYQPIDLSQWPQLLAASSTPAQSPSEVARYLVNAPDSGSRGPTSSNERRRAIVVDNTSDQQVAEAYPDFLRQGISVVTPNKKAFSSGDGLWKEIFSAAASSKAIIYHESSVGAGLPIISTLKDLVVSGDQVRRIQGIFSGTMSYLFNTFSPADDSGAGSTPWSQIVSQAKDAGFTEPDPRDDLNGMDVARKLTILARIAGLDVAGPTAFPVQSLIPKALSENSPDQPPLSTASFLAQLPTHDADMESYKTAARAEGKVVRYLATIDLTAPPAHALTVGLESVAPTSPMASLRGSDNLICFHTARYADSPLVVQGAGAGADVTAMGVTADLVRVMERLG